MSINKLYTRLVILCSIMVFSSCESGLTYEEAPESVYSEVGVTSFALNGREFFENKIFAPNWNKWVEGYIDTRAIGTGSTITVEDHASAPGGKLHVISFSASDRATYQTANKGYLFDKSKFSGDFFLIDPIINERSQKVSLPIRKNEVIGEIYLVDQYKCIVEPVDGAPELGKPGDFTVPRRYLVKNVSHLPAGVQQYTRLYEIRVTFQSNQP